MADHTLVAPTSHGEVADNPSFIGEGLGAGNAAPFVWDFSGSVSGTSPAGGVQLTPIATNRATALTAFRPDGLAIQDGDFVFQNADDTGFPAGDYKYTGGALEAVPYRLAATPEVLTSQSVASSLATPSTVDYDAGQIILTSTLNGQNVWGDPLNVPEGKYLLYDIVKTNATDTLLFGGSNTIQDPGLDAAFAAVQAGGRELVKVTRIGTNFHARATGGSGVDSDSSKYVDAANSGELQAGLTNRMTTNTGVYVLSPDTRDEISVFAQTIATFNGITIGPGISYFAEEGGQYVLKSSGDNIKAHDTLTGLGNDPLSDPETTLYTLVFIGGEATATLNGWYVVQGAVGSKSWIQKTQGV